MALCNWGSIFSFFSSPSQRGIRSLENFVWYVGVFIASGMAAADSILSSFVHPKKRMKYSPKSFYFSWQAGDA